MLAETYSVCALRSPAWMRDGGDFTRLFPLWSQQTPLLRGGGIQSGSSKPLGQARRMGSYQRSSLPSAWVKREWDKSQVSNKSFLFWQKYRLSMWPNPLSSQRGNGRSEARAPQRAPTSDLLRDSRTPGLSQRAGYLPSCPVPAVGCSDERSILS